MRTQKESVTDLQTWAQATVYGDCNKIESLVREIRNNIDQNNFQVGSLSNEVASLGLDLSRAALLLSRMADLAGRE